MINQDNHKEIKDETQYDDTQYWKDTANHFLELAESDRHTWEQQEIQLKILLKQMEAHKDLIDFYEKRERLNREKAEHALNEVRKLKNNK